MDNSFLPPSVHLQSLPTPSKMPSRPQSRPLSLQDSMFSTCRIHTFSDTSATFSISFYFKLEFSSAALCRECFHTRLSPAPQVGLATVLAVTHLPRTCSSQGREALADPANVWKGPTAMDLAASIHLSGPNSCDRVGIPYPRAREGLVANWDQLCGRPIMP